MPVPVFAVSEWAREALGFEADETQARVLDSGSRYGLLNCTRQWGKSTVAAVKAVWQAWTDPGSLTVVVSPSARQSGEFVRKARAFALKLERRVKGDGDNEISIELRNGSRIVGLPGNETTTRGFSAAALLLVDEASRVSDDLYKALRPVLAASGGSLWLMSTPFGKRGFFWEAWENGGAEWERIMAPATECPRLDQEALEQDWRTMGEAWFRQEYMCEFVDTVSGVFDRDVVESAVTDEFGPLRL